jgi:hypothetical protein
MKNSGDMEKDIRMAQALIQRAKECLWNHDTDPKIWDVICRLENIRNEIGHFSNDFPW